MPRTKKSDLLVEKLMDKRNSNPEFASASRQRTEEPKIEKPKKSINFNFIDLSKFIPTEKDKSLNEIIMGENNVFNPNVPINEEVFGKDNFTTKKFDPVEPEKVANLIKNLWNLPKKDVQKIKWLVDILKYIAIQATIKTAQAGLATGTIAVEAPVIAVEGGVAGALVFASNKLQDYIDNYDALHAKAEEAKKINQEVLDIVNAEIPMDEKGKKLFLIIKNNDGILKELMVAMEINRTELDKVEKGIKKYDEVKNNLIDVNEIINRLNENENKLLELEGQETQQQPTIPPITTIPVPLPTKKRLPKK